MSVTSDDTYYSHQNYINRIRGIATGMCSTPTKQSALTYSYIKDFSSEGSDSTYVIEANKTKMHTRSSSSHTCSYMDDIKNMDKKAHKFHGYRNNVGNYHPRIKGDGQIFHKAERSLCSFRESNISSYVSWSNPSFLDEEFKSEKNMKNSSEYETRSINSSLKHIRRNSNTEDEKRQIVYDTPKRISLKPLEFGRRYNKRKPIRLANLPRKIYPRDRTEIRLEEGDIKITDPNADNRDVDTHEYLKKTRRRLKFDPENSSTQNFPSTISKELKEDSELVNNLDEEGFPKKQPSYENNGDLKQKLEEKTDNTLFLEKYFEKVLEIVNKPPVTKRIQMFEQGIFEKRYFDFQDYCEKLNSLKEKFVGQK